MIQFGHNLSQRIKADEDGFTLIEAVIVVALSTMLVLLGGSLMSISASAINSATVQSNLATQAELTMRTAVNNLSNSLPLGECYDTQVSGSGTDPDPFNTKFSKCAHPEPVPLASASGPTDPNCSTAVCVGGGSLFSATSNGICYYDYAEDPTLPPGSPGGPPASGGLLNRGAPSLQCIWIDTNRGLWVSTWDADTPGTGSGTATYTDCAPGEPGDPPICWSGTKANATPGFAGFTEGYTPPNPQICNPVGGACPRSQVLLGTLGAQDAKAVAPTVPWFQYLDGNQQLVGGGAGYCASPAVGNATALQNLKVCLASIALVRFTIQVSQTNSFHYLATQQKRTATFTLNYLASIRGNAYQREQLWNNA